MAYVGSKPSDTEQRHKRPDNVGYGSDYVQGVARSQAMLMGNGLSSPPGDPPGTLEAAARRQSVTVATSPTTNNTVGEYAPSDYAHMVKQETLKQEKRKQMFPRPIFLLPSALRRSTEESDEDQGKTKKKGIDVSDILRPFGLCPNLMYMWHRATFAFRLSAIPWMPPPVDSITKDKKGPFRIVHELFVSPEESKLALILNLTLFFAIIVSTCTFVVETSPSLLRWKPECEERCKPLKGVARYDPDEVERRADDAGYCAEKACEPSENEVCKTIETIAVILFTCELGLRYITAWAVRSAEEVSRDPSKVYNPVTGAVVTQAGYEVSEVYEFHQFKYTKRMLLYVFDPMNIIDLLAILPFYVSMGNGGSSLIFFRLLRLFRVIRLLKVLVIVSRIKRTQSSYMYFSETLLLTFDVFMQARRSLAVAFMYTVFFMLVFAAVVFTAERGTWDDATGEYLVSNLYYLEPEGPSKFTSIPDTFWWVLVTFTTVGYGDMSPTTGWGRAIGVIVMYSGVLVIALPITIISTTFRELYDDLEQRRRRANEIFINNGTTFLDCFFKVHVMPLRRCFDKWLNMAQQHITFTPFVPIQNEILELRECNMRLEKKIEDMMELFLAETARLHAAITGGTIVNQSRTASS